MSEFMTIDQVLELVPCMTRANLATMRYDRRGPKFFKPTARTVLYDRQSVLDWVKSSVVETATAVDTSATARPRDTRPSNRKGGAR